MLHGCLNKKHLRRFKYFGSSPNVMTTSVRQKHLPKKSIEVMPRPTWHILPLIHSIHNPSRHVKSSSLLSILYHAVWSKLLPLISSNTTQLRFEIPHHIPQLSAVLTAGSGQDLCTTCQASLSHFTLNFPKLCWLVQGIPYTLILFREWELFPKFAGTVKLLYLLAD